MTSAVSSTAAVGGSHPSGASTSGSSSGFLHHTTTNTAAPITAPIIEPPEAFGTVAPGIYRCDASSLTKGLPTHAANSSNGTQQRTTLYGGSNQNSFSSSSSSTLPIDSFLISLRLKTILLLAHEKKPTPLTLWCTHNQVELVHLGLGALAEKAFDSGAAKSDPSFSTNSSHKSTKVAENITDTGILSMERIVKDSLEIILDRYRLPCLICDTSGVKETGVVVACLRRMQRRSFASIRYEYRTFAGSRARSSHERFIEIFDPDLISLPHQSRLPTWFAQQQKDDEEEEDESLAQ